MTRRGRPSVLTLAIVLGTACPAPALQPDEILPDPALEARARTISGGLRCVVCQNQSIDDSDAPLARDLRILVRERLTAGDDDAAINRFLVQRYGEFVLLKPAWGWHTAVLWLGPASILLAALAGIAAVRRRREVAADAPLTPDELSRIRALEATSEPPPVRPPSG